MPEPTEDNVEKTAPDAPSDAETPDETSAAALADAGELTEAEQADFDAPPAPQAASLRDTLPDHAGRLLNLPVKVIVYLAEKKIPVEQLLTICPGSLITFSKPCEDLLDMYVNNHRYCRGEAVKIGEKFGIKISEVGVVEVRESPILV